MKSNTYSIIQSTLYVALLVISSLIVIPIPFSVVGITLQTVVINVMVLMLKPKYSLITIIIYIFLGLLGLPVFGGGTPGIAKILTPASGYYVGFILSVFAMGIAKKQEMTLKNNLIITTIIGLPIQHICAIIVMLFFNNFNLLNSIITISLPFIIGDVVKCIISSYVALKLSKITS